MGSENVGDGDKADRVGNISLRNANNGKRDPNSAGKSGQDLRGETAAMGRGGVS